MKQMFLSLAFASLVAVPALHAAGPQTGKPAPATKTPSAATQTHVVNAEFVAYDAKTHKMTIKDDQGQTSTVPLERTAIREVGQLHLKDGDHLTLTCRDANGEHKAVSSVKRAKPPQA